MRYLFPQYWFYFVIAFGVISCGVSDDSSQVAVTIKHSGNNSFSLIAGDLSVSVDGSAAGRVSRLTLGGKEFLSGSDVSVSNWGATHWPSPQSLFNWPPPDAFDKVAAVTNIEGGTIVSKLVSDDIKTKIQFTKTISYNAEKDWFDLKLNIKNNNISDYSVAPWLITRVPAEGFIFCPVDENLIDTPMFPYTLKSGVFWFDYSGSTSLISSKLIADGKEGWIAHYTDGYLFVHKYNDVEVSKIAPLEGDVEIYVADNKTYVEIEPQGEYRSIPAGESIDWTVSWIAIKVEEGNNVSFGSQYLVDLARTLIK